MNETAYYPLIFEIDFFFCKLTYSSLSWRTAAVEMFEFGAEVQWRPRLTPS